MATTKPMKTEDWQPINAAPLDRKLLVGGGDTPIAIGFWDAFSGHWRSECDDGSIISPRYWMPLPEDHEDK
jgi:hypothetical protein